MTYRERMETKLTEAFAPEFLFIRDDSDRHAGHSGAHEEGETHFFVEIRAAAFEGKSRLERQRLIMKTLQEEMEERVHALSLKVDGPKI